MNRLLMVIPLVFLCCFTVGCEQSDRVLLQPLSEPADVEADIQAIKEVVSELETAANTSNLDSIASLYTDDAIQILPNEPAHVGKEAIRSRIQQFFDQMTEFTFEEKYVIQDVRVSGNLAVAYLTWSGIYTPKAGGEPSRHNGDSIMDFEKQSNGAWKILYWIWSDEKLVYPDQAE